MQPLDPKISTIPVLDALNQAIYNRQPAQGSLIHHSDRGMQCLSNRCAERLGEAGIDMSVGSVGDSCDNALAESVIGLFKAEVIHGSLSVKSSGRRCNGSALTTQNGFMVPLDTGRRRKWRTTSMKT